METALKSTKLARMGLTPALAHWGLRCLWRKILSLLTSADTEAVSEN